MSLPGGVLPGEVPATSEVEVAGTSARLLSFYDRLRSRVERALARRGPLAAKAGRYLLLVPDVFMLLARLAMDPEVPRASRALVGGALAYFLLPADLLPEAFLGIAGTVDDLVLACAVLAHAFGGELEPHARRHWSGGESLRAVVGDVLGAADALLGERLYTRLRQLLARRGITLPEQSL